MKLHVLIANKDTWEKVDTRPAFDSTFEDIDIITDILKVGKGEFIKKLVGSKFYGEDVLYDDDNVYNYGYVTYDNIKSLIKEQSSKYYVSSAFWKEFIDRGGVLPKGMNLSCVDFDGSAEVGVDIVEDESKEIKLYKKMLLSINEDEVYVIAFDKEN